MFEWRIRAIGSENTSSTKVNSLIVNGLSNLGRKVGKIRRIKCKRRNIKDSNIKGWRYEGWDYDRSIRNTEDERREWKFFLFLGIGRVEKFMIFVL